MDRRTVITLFAFPTFQTKKDDFLPTALLIITHYDHYSL